MLRLIDCIEAVAFDLDGTLIDTAPDLAAAANMMLGILGGRPLPERCVPALIGEGIDRFVAQSARGKRRRRRRRIRRCSRLRPRSVSESLRAASVRAQPHLSRRRRRRCDALANAALPLCCITNKESRFALPLLEAAGLREKLCGHVCAPTVRRIGSRARTCCSPRAVSSASSQRNCCTSATRLRTSPRRARRDAASWRSTTAITAITTLLARRGRTASSAI